MHRCLSRRCSRNTGRILVNNLNAEYSEKGAQGTSGMTIDSLASAACKRLMQTACYITKDPVELLHSEMSWSQML